MQTLSLIRPDDWHLHLRDGAALRITVPDAARRFARALVMPNLRPPVTTVAQAADYRERILKDLPEDLKFEPLMTLYLTDNTVPDEIDRAVDSGFVHAVKLYPAGATTNSDAGVTAIEKVHPVLERMQRRGLVLCVHGEVTHADIDVFDRERVFIDRVFAPLTQAFPDLRSVFEHITTREAAQYVSEAPDNVAATITAHHLLLNRNAMLVGGIRPHHYCLPVLKREIHRQALLAAATSGNPRFFLGTDSAPHAKSTKEAACGCAGCYTEHAAIELYAEAFESANALDSLESFASFHGADWYGLPRSQERITLVKEAWTVPATLDYLPEDPIVPLRAGESIGWRLA
ncbi:MAG: dihydroorotase [Candidatus Dactylopiibacterium carminicum]|uniref:Dihydroorotase n=1 Tax=Candidatus Dactylopiibacterium carminicum TaxID=857335 RepID=A0A272EN05_9RHOO|nr:dihydroorotase [Candidatus Dactylopiibacterium carminicum]KAF7597907.1 dihydroorotase [Candidatus Dactylopiibacterium carminicum]PAS91483.1 MAG: dihydroorotase [Candidatus Dactylopiibacterium carminicum]PAS92968.1 MAG: dihydroorotase [Candidatus Dactylopiibacterium carminicum]PAS95928.1 MAG: dihydroorotase [Candidatus Dactylopiibacterium carminicum]